jgi:hypothetical protein
LGKKLGGTALSLVFRCFLLALLLTDAASSGSHVCHPCARSNHDASPCQLGPPREVLVFDRGSNSGVKTSDGTENVEAHQEESSGCQENVAHFVMLAVVDFVRFHSWYWHSGLVYGHAYAEQALLVVPGHVFGTHHCCIQPEGLLYHALERVGVRSHVIMAEHHEPLVIKAPEEGVDGASKAQTRVQPLDCCIGEIRAGQDG